MNDEQLAFDHLNRIFTDFRQERREVAKRTWFRIPSLLKRILNPDKEYPHLRTQDQGFFHRMQPALRREIDSGDFAIAQLDAYLTGLKAHVTTLRGHYQRLISSGVYLLLIAAIFRECRDIIPAGDAIYATVVIIVSLLIAVAGFQERVKNQEWVADYEAFVVLLEHEVERRKGCAESGGEDSLPQ